MNVTHKPSGSVLARSRPDLVAQIDPEKPAAEDSAIIPTIKLGGLDYEVPEFTWRELKTLLPMMRKCIKIKFEDLTDQDMDLLADLVFFVIRRVMNTATREMLDESYLRIGDIVRAIPVIAKQAGMESGRGEAEAASSG